MDLRWALNPNTGVLIKEKRDLTHGKGPVRTKTDSGAYATTVEERKSHQKLEEARKDPPLGGGSGP